MTIEQLLCPAVMTWERDFRKKLNESHIEMTDDEIADEFDKWLVENEDLVNKSVEDNIGHIITLLMADLNKRLVDKEITVELTDTAKQFITDNGYDPVYGARPLKRYLQKHVETLAAKLILADGVRAGDTILIDVKDDKLSASAVQKNA